MFDKINDKWKLRSNSIDSSSIPIINIFDVNDNNNNAIVYTPAYSLDDIFENHRAYYGYSQDKYAFWIDSAFDKQTIIDEYFYNINYVDLISSDEIMYYNPSLRQSKDYVNLSNVTNTIIDGIKLEHNTKVLLKNQYEENLALYNIQIIGKKRVKIIDTTPAQYYNYLNVGNDAVFYDGSGTFLGYIKITSIKTKVEYISSQYRNTIIIDFENAVPLTTTQIADSIDGNWERSDFYTENGIYIYDAINNVFNIADDLSTEEKSTKYIVYPTKGITNINKHFYLTIDDSSKLYPIQDGSNSIIFKQGNISVIGHKLSYNLNKETISSPYKFLILDLEIAKNCGEIDLDNINDDINGSYGVHNANPVTLANFNTIDTLLNTFYIMPLGDNDEDVNIVHILNDDEITSVTLTESNLFTSLKSELYTANHLTVNETVDVFQDSNYLSLYLGSSPDIIINTGNTLRIRVTLENDVVNPTYILDENFVVQDYSNDAVLIYPYLPQEFFTELNIAKDNGGYAVEITNLSYYRDCNELVEHINLSQWGKYYYAYTNGTDFSIKYASTPYSRYKSLNTIINYDGDDYILEPTNKVIYEQNYTPYKLLNILNPSTYDNAYDITPNTDFDDITITYDNTQSADRFGIFKNQLIFGSNHTINFKVGAVINITYITSIDSTTQSINTIINTIYTNSLNETIVVLNDVIKVTLPTTNDDVDITLVTNLKDYSNIIKNIYLYQPFKQNIYSQELYANIFSKDLDIRDDVSAILFKNDKSIVKCILSKNSSDITSDTRRLFEPIEVFKVGADKLLSTSKSITNADWYEDENAQIHISITNSKFNKLRFIDGLTEHKIRNNIDNQGIYSWILLPSVITSNAIVGRDASTNRLIWYSGEWKSGDFENGIWYSGQFRNGTFKNSDWFSYYVIDYGNSVNVIKSSRLDSYSKFYNGKWINGNWYGGSFINGTWYNGTWVDGTWFNGNWYNGTWVRGIWVRGNWYNGTWNGGDFESGSWYNGIWNTSIYAISRFGTKSTSTNKSFWYDGIWNGGEFHSFVQYDSSNNTTISKNANLKYSIWFNGIWNDGSWYGGSFIFGKWKNGNWYNGLWVGGYYATLSYNDAFTKRLTLTTNGYNTLLSISNNKSYIKTGTQLLITSRTSNSTVISQQLFGDMYDNNTALSNCYYVATAISDNVLQIDMTGSSTDVSTTTYIAEDVPNNIPSGSPFVNAIWENGTFHNGKWLNGVFINGTFKGVAMNGTFLFPMITSN